MNNKKQRNRLFTMLLLVMAILMPYEGAWAQTPKRPASGDGKVDTPFLISTAAELAWFRDYVNGTIVNKGEEDGTTHPSASAKLTTDIDLSEFCHAADDDNGKEYFSAKKQNYLNTSIDPPLALGATFFTGSKLTLTIDVDTKYVLKGKPTLIDITDDNGNIVGKSFDLAVEDYTDNDYNDIYVNIVGWTHKG